MFAHALRDVGPVVGFLAAKCDVFRGFVYQLTGFAEGIAGRNQVEYPATVC